MSSFTWDEFLVEEKKTKDSIDFKRCYADMAGDLVAGIVLSQIVYWNLPGKTSTKLRVEKEGFMWLAKEYGDWWDEIRITKEQAKRAVTILKKKNLIITAIHRYNGMRTLHMRINIGEFLSSWIRFNGYADIKPDISVVVKDTYRKMPTTLIEKRQRRRHLNKEQITEITHKDLPLHGSKANALQKENFSSSQEASTVSGKTTPIAGPTPITEVSGKLGDLNKRLSEYPFPHSVYQTDTTLSHINFEPIYAALKNYPDFEGGAAWADPASQKDLDQVAGVAIRKLLLLGKKPAEIVAAINSLGQTVPWFSWNDIYSALDCLGNRAIWEEVTA